MLSVSVLFAFLILAFILLFLSGLPDLRMCSLPVTASSDCRRSDCRSAWICVLLIMLAYSAAAFYHLGNTKSPQSFVRMQNNPAVISLNQEKTPAYLLLFPGVGIGSYSIETSEDAEGWIPISEFSQDHVAVLKWQRIDLTESVLSNYIRICCVSGDPWLGEIGLISPEGERIDFLCSLKELSDEQELLQTTSNYRNSSYFDEIYHARTAWEQLNGIWPYEISHPPLGKEIMSLGILLFGMTPLGWRFSGTIIGILMLPLMFLFLQRLFRNKRISILGTILLAAGFMHYSQTRIATIDSYAVFFILLMYYFMHGWIFEDSIRDLGLCGIAFGFGAASKWTCLYAGAGLAVLWLAHWVWYAYKNPKESGVVFFKNCLFCLFFFILIPACIYYLSYFPYGSAKGYSLFSREYLQMVIDNQSFMFHYHSGIVAEHPYSSRWYQWILDLRPILYYLEYYSDGTRSSIAAFVNPLICWTGLLSLPILVFMAAVRHERTACFLLVAYASGIVPWMFINRLTFAYHYFASALFLIPMICYLFFLIETGNRYSRYFTVGFTACAVFLFILFFPILNGIPVDNVKTSELLGWLPSWPI